MAARRTVAGETFDRRVSHVNRRANDNFAYGGGGDPRLQYSPSRDFNRIRRITRNATTGIKVDPEVAVFLNILPVNFSILYKNSNISLHRRRAVYATKSADFASHSRHIYATVSNTLCDSLFCAIVSPRRRR